MLAVDPFDDPRWGGGSSAAVTFAENLRVAGVTDEINTFRGTSAEAATSWDGARIGLLYLDGAHDRRSVVDDLRTWGPLVDDGGYLLIHDAFSSRGVTSGLLRVLLLNRRFTYADCEGSLVVFRRIAVSRATAFRNRLRLLLRLAYFGRNVMVHLALRRRNTRVLRLLGHEGFSSPF
jgi:GNAT superfamily N-acetyltransferase